MDNLRYLLFNYKVHKIDSNYTARWAILKILNNTVCCHVIYFPKNSINKAAGQPDVIDVMLCWFQSKLVFY